MKSRSAVWRVFAMPLLLAVLTTFGLLAALLLEPLGRYAAWVALALPIIVVGWAWWRRRSSRSRSKH